jgi:NADPH:quinone reductase-like Zn-dependent oxidoreductase
MRIFFAGASGVIGERLLPLLVAAGHEVAGMTRSPGKIAELRALGAEPVLCDVYDADALREAVVLYRPEAVMRLQLLEGYRTQIKALDLEEKQVLAQLDALVRRSGSTLGELSGLSTRSVAELLVEVGDARRFTEGGFARFNGSAPLPASTAEGPASRYATATTPAVTGG